MDLTGKLLIAMPGMPDPRFELSVIYICAHSDEGAMGLIVNKPSDELKFSDLQDQLDLPQGDCPDFAVHFGGPVEFGRGFVLHSTDYSSAPSQTMTVDDNFGLTSTMAILSDVARGRGPDQIILALGYSGWGPGQLEDEISANGWLTCDSDPGLVFGGDNDVKWTAALKTMGVDPMLLSAEAGRA
ncbi:YqgE/AlgH family protein [Actibacterium mucosum]|nr:YqgE/AlgH family protein [Actibacterium mucosum]